MPYDPKKFFDVVRTELYGGIISQSQVDGFNFLLAVWERHFEENNPRDGTNWLAYCMATVYHETAYTIQPIEEYGKGKGKKYGEPTDPYGHCYYGRGYPQLTWDYNYKNGSKYMLERYGVKCDLLKEPHRALEHEISALVLMDGMIYGWFTGVGLPKYFNATVEDPKNARRTVNGTDKMDLIASYYWKFKKALVKLPKGVAPPLAATDEGQAKEISEELMKEQEK
jgi:putative chitinase